MLLASFLSLSSAVAAPMLGSSASFPETAFCKNQGCKHYYTLQHTPALKEYVYSMAPDQYGLETGTTRIYRNNAAVVSASYSTGAQDNPMLSESTYKHVGGLINLMTGKMPSRDYLMNLNCESAPNLPAVTKYQGVGKMYTLSCVAYPLTGAWMYVYNVY